MSFLERLKRLLGEAGPPEEMTAPDKGSSEQDSGSECKPITCMEALERVHEYLDGELTAVSHEEVARHFSMCQRCYPHLRLEERFKEALQRSQKDEVCPDHLKSRVLELLGTDST